MPKLIYRDQEGRPERCRHDVSMGAGANGDRCHFSGAGHSRADQAAGYFPIHEEGPPPWFWIAIEGKNEKTKDKKGKAPGGKAAAEK